MSIKDRLANKSASVGTMPRATQENSAPGKPKTGAGQLMQSLPMLAEKDDEIASLKQQLDNATQNTAALELPLSDLKEVPGRRRKLTREQFAELRENLRNNPLISAITVRARPAGGYEIISGHNRVAAFRELGREKILAVTITASDADSELASFYANLLQSGLPDYEKYLGFRRRRETTGKTQRELASEAGVSPAFVSMLMAFDGLPPEITRQLDDRPDLIGANAAEDFSKLMEQGRKEQVIAAIAAVAEGRLTQAAALRKASRDEAAAPSKAETKKYRSGKAVFAEVRGVGKVLRISFRSEEERVAIEKAIGDVLQQFAAGKGSNDKT
jgi:ParB family chromosome partitioning protein